MNIHITHVPCNPERKYRFAAHDNESFDDETKDDDADIGDIQIEGTSVSYQRPIMTPYIGM